MPLKRSWVESANDAGCPFPLNNLPCGVFSAADGAKHCGTAIGDRILDVTALEKAGLISLDGSPLLDQPRWNGLMAAGPDVWNALRTQLTGLLEKGAARRSAVEPHLAPLAGAELHLPFHVAEYTDFYAGRHHAFNVGTMFRGAGKCAAAQLVAHSDRLQWPRLVGGGLGHRRASSMGSIEGPR
jgi:fumarylacetoacetase